MEDGSESNRNGSSLQEKAAQQNGQLQIALRKIGRARTRLMVCFLTLPVYVITVWLLLNNQHNTDSFMFIYMAMWAAFAVDMARRRCPSCGQQFFVKSILLNLISKRCVHCGIELNAVASANDEEDSVHF